VNVVAVTKKKPSEAANMTMTLRGIATPAGSIRAKSPVPYALQALMLRLHTLDGWRLDI